MLPEACSLQCPMLANAGHPACSAVSALAAQWVAPPAGLAWLAACRSGTERSTLTPRVARKRGREARGPIPSIKPCAGSQVGQIKNISST